MTTPTPPAVDTRDVHGGDAEVERRVQALFGERDESRRPRRVLRVVAVVATLAIVLGAVLVARSGGSDSGTYRTATAATGDAAAELSAVATLEPVSQAAVAFPVDGTVATVDVAVGDEVALGQQLAGLDTGELERTLHQRQAALAEAELALAKALDGESTDDGTATGGGTATAVPTSLITADTTDTVDAVLVAAVVTDDGQLAALQQAVLDAQRAVDEALLASEAALAAATTVCDADGESATTTTTTVDGTAGTTTDTTACLTALADAQEAQQATAAAQRTLASASTALDEHLAALAADAGTSGSGGSASGSAGGNSTGTQQGSGSTGSSVAGTTSTAPSAADLVAYQKAVDAAALNLTVAEQALAQATVVAPLAGTVVAVGLEVGDDVTAASATQTVLIQGPGGVEVVTTVALSEISDVAVGQAAVVVPDGSDAELAGQVVAVAAVPDDDSTAYRVTIGLDDPAVDVGNGATGTVRIVTGEARTALTVPSSAVRWEGGAPVVTVRRTDGTEDVRVTVGVVGADRIEILSGLDEGDTVVLADLDEPLPGAATEAGSSSGAPAGAGVDGQTGGGFPGGADGGPPAMPGS